jgi:hypothetical protein
MKNLFNSMFICLKCLFYVTEILFHLSRTPKGAITKSRILDCDVLGQVTETTATTTGEFASRQ